jgi:predicted phage terminase large subunit-like protein
MGTTSSRQYTTPPFKYCARARERLLGGNWKIRPAAGLYFKREWCAVVDEIPADLDVVRYWDLATTEKTEFNDPDWTVGIKLGCDKNGRYWLLDIVRARANPGDVDRLLLNTVEQDGKRSGVGFGQDPGQAGKSQALHLVRSLSGFTVRPAAESGDKLTRFGPFSSQCRAGVRRLAQALQAQGHEVSRTLVGHLLNEAGYSLQGNRKTTEGDSHPDRDAQFGYINTQVSTALAEQQPVISVDTKKKELVGDFRNNGREYRPQGNPEEVRVHDFLIKELGRAVPYGVYDLAANSGWVSVGVDHDTAAFAVNSIRQWWLTVGRARYPQASRLLITADGGGSNGSRVRLWKRELQKLANEFGIDIVVSHLPPGTSKWNKIEHRLFSFISQNWRAKPLVSYRVIVELISATTTKTGLTVRCELDTGRYPSGMSSPTPRWPLSTSNVPSSTASGTTPSHQVRIAQIARLSRDEP